MQYVSLLIVALVLNAGSSVFYKFSSLNAEKKALSVALLGAGLLLGAVNATLYTKSLQGIRLNVAYPIFSAGSLLLVALISVFVFGESLGPLKLAGMALLVVGVALVSA